MMVKQWWDYLLSNKMYWHNGFTERRLSRVKEFILSDADVRWDLKRHGEERPYDMKINDPFMYEHCISNFTAHIRMIMIEQKILKR